MIKTVSALNLDECASSELDSLRAACVAADGAVCLETESALNAHRDMKSLYLAYEGNRLLGALSLFAPLKSEAEINALVLPEARRRGIFRLLLAEAELELSGFGYAEELFVLDSRSDSGKSVAARLGACYEYTEYAMRYTGPCPDIPSRGLEIFRAGPDSVAELVDLRAGEFGDSREEAESFERATFASADRQVYAALLGKKLVAACSLGFFGKTVSINGLVVDRELRGRGYGQDLLARIISLLDAQGLEMILDVNSQNANACHIYRKMGFMNDKAVDYYRRANFTEGRCRT